MEEPTKERSRWNLQSRPLSAYRPIVVTANTVPTMFRHWQMAGTSLYKRCHSFLTVFDHFATNLHISPRRRAWWDGSPKHNTGGCMKKATGRRVLVVDDDPDTTNSFVDVLTLLGHEARGAYDGPNALILVAQFDPEIVLLDIAMPGMDGYELAEHIRDQQVHKPVVIIAVTGWGRKADVDRSLAVGSTTTWSSQYTTTFWSRCLHGARAIFQV